MTSRRSFLGKMVFGLGALLLGKRIQKPVKPTSRFLETPYLLTENGFIRSSDLDLVTQRELITNGWIGPYPYGLNIGNTD